MKARRPPTDGGGGGGGVVDDGEGEGFCKFKRRLRREGTSNHRVGIEPK
jgi:hypothetical protein